MKSLILFFTLLMIISIHSLAQYTDWVTFTNCKNIRCYAKEGNYLWIVTVGGLVKLDKSNGTSITFNKHNSDIPTIEISSIVVDTSGNKWMGTSYGLVKFDNINWTIYNTSNSPISNNCVINLCFDHYNNLWIAHRSSLDRLSGSTWKMFDPSNSPVPEDTYSLTCMSADKSRNIYFGMNGLVKYDGTNWTVYDRNNSGIQNDVINDITVDTNNNIWLGCSRRNGVGGLVRLADTTFTVFMAGTNVENVASDANNNVWVSSSCSLIKFDGSTYSSYDSHNSQVNDMAPDNNILEDSGNIWYCNKENNVLRKFDGNYYVDNFDISDCNITNNNVGYLAVDALKNVWLSFGFQGCYSPRPYYGIDKFYQNTFSNYNTDNSSIPFDDVTNLASDLKNNLWLGTYSHGIIKYNGSSWIVFDTLNSDLPSNKIYGQHSITFDSFGNTYVLFSPSFDGGGNFYGGGIAKYNGTSWTKIIPSYPVSYSDYYSIVVDHQDNLWVTGYGVILKYDGTNWTFFDHSNSPFLSNSFSSIAVDLLNNIWISSYADDELIKIENSNFTIYKTSNSSLPNKNITSISVDAKNNIWIGFSYTGLTNYVLSKFDGNTFTNFGIDNSGLNHDYVSQVVAVENKIYITNLFGLTIFTDNTITGIVNQPVEKRIIQNIYPNPSSDKIMIDYNLNNSIIASLEIYNSSNQMVIKTNDLSNLPGNNKVEINIKNLSEGFYYCKLKTSQYVSISKFLVSGN